MPWGSGDALTSANLNSKSGQVFNVGEYGSVGTMDDTATILAAYNAAVAAGGGTIRGATNVTHPITALMVSANNIFLDFSSSVVVGLSGIANQGVVTATGSLTSTATTLTADAAIGVSTVSVVSSAGFTSGDTVEINSSAVINAHGPYLIELNVVDSVGVGTLKFKRAVRNAYLQSDGSTVTITKLTPLLGFGAAFREIQGAGGTDGDGLRVAWAIEPYIEAQSVHNFGDRGIIAYRTQGGLITGSMATSGSDPASCWGIAAHSCQDLTVASSRVRDISWDGFDVSYGTMHCHFTDLSAANCNDYGLVAGHGLHGHHNTYSQISIACGNATSAGGVSVGDPSYAGDDDNEFNLITVAGGGNPFNVRNGSARNKLSSCRSAGSTSSGYIVQTGAVDTELWGCEAAYPTNHGVSATAPVKVIGGWYHDCATASANGLRISGSGAAGSYLERVKTNATNGPGILVINTSNVPILECECDNTTGTLANGIMVQDSTNCLVRNPTVTTTTGWGVQVYESSPGNCSGSGVENGIFSGNVLGTVFASVYYQTQTTYGSGQFRRGLTVGFTGGPGISTTVIGDTTAVKDRVWKDQGGQWVARMSTDGSWALRSYDSLGVFIGQPLAAYQGSGTTLTIARPLVYSVVSTPAGGDSGITGQIYYDGSYVYVCTSANSWRRATLAKY